MPCSVGLHNIDLRVFLVTISGSVSYVCPVRTPAGIRCLGHTQVRQASPVNVYRRHIVAAEEEELEFALAPNGIISLECAVGLYAKALIATKLLTWPELIARMTVGPAAVIRKPLGTLAVGADLYRTPFAAAAASGNLVHVYR